MTPLLLQTIAGAIVAAEGHGLVVNLSEDWNSLEFEGDGPAATAWAAMFRDNKFKVIEVLRECRVQAEVAIEKIQGRGL